MVQEPPSTTSVLSALGNEKRLQIMRWLADPVSHFPPQVDGDLLDDGVCLGFIAEKLGLRQPTVTNHMKILFEAGLVERKRIKNWVFFKARPETALAALDRVAAMISE